MNKASLLANFPGFVNARVPQDLVVFFDDFTSMDINASPDVNRWYYSPIAGGLTMSLLDGASGQQYEAGGILKAITGNTADDGGNLQANGEMFSIGVAGYPLYFETRFACLDVSNLDVMIGLSITDAEVLTGGASDDMGFRLVGGTLSFVSEKNGTEKSTDCAITETDAQMIRAVMYYDGDDTIYAYIDDDDDGDFQLKATRIVSTAAHYVPNDEMLTPTIELITGATASAETGWIDYVFCTQPRKT